MNFRSEDIQKLSDAVRTLSELTVRDGVFALSLIAFVVIPIIIFVFYKNGLLGVAKDPVVRESIQRDFSLYLRSSIGVGMLLFIVASGFWIWREANNYTHLGQQIERLAQENKRLSEQIEARATVIYGQIENTDDSDTFYRVYLDNLVYFLDMTVNNRKMWVFAIILNSDSLPSNISVGHSCKPGPTCASQGRPVTLILPKHHTARRSYAYSFNRGESLLQPKD